jgi:hypothetical protein
LLVRHRSLVRLRPDWNFLGGFWEAQRVHNSRVLRPRKQTMARMGADQCQFGTTLARAKIRHKQVWY